MSRYLFYRSCGCRNDWPCAPSCAAAPVDPRSRPSAAVVAEIEAISRASFGPRVVNPSKRRMCSVPGCDRRRDAKGFCPFHYNLAARIGEAAARLVPAAVVRRCALCETPIGAANVSGVCRPCRIYVARRPPPAARRVAPRRPIMPLVADPRLPSVCECCTRPASPGSRSRFCPRCRALVRCTDELRAALADVPGPPRRQCARLGCMAHLATNDPLTRHCSGACASIDWSERVLGRAVKEMARG